MKNFLITLANELISISLPMQAIRSQLSLFYEIIKISTALHPTPPGELLILSLLLELGTSNFDWRTLVAHRTEYQLKKLPN